jgi:Sec-independent protein secretion pathway component TatC
MLYEAQVRLAYVILSCIMSFGCSYILSDRIVQIFAIPLEDVYYRAQGAVLGSTNFPPRLEHDCARAHSGELLAERACRTLSDKDNELQYWLMENMDPFGAYEAVTPPFHLIFTELTEAFGSTIYVCLLVSFYLSSAPAIFIQVWWFIKPGLYNHEKRRVVVFLTMSICLSLVHVCATYYFILPAACTFFSSFSTCPSPNTT